MSDNETGVYSGPFQVEPADLRLFAQAGACLLEWGVIDNILFSICSAALGVSEDIAAVVYARTPTLETRIALIAGLLEARFPTRSGGKTHELRIKSGKLFKKARHLSEIRNDIAHGQRHQLTWLHSQQTNASDEGPGFHSVILPSIHRKGQNKSIDLADMTKNQKEVFDLSIELRQLHLALLATLVLGSAEQDSTPTNHT